MCSGFTHSLELPVLMEIFGYYINLHSLMFAVFKALNESRVSFAADRLMDPLALIQSLNDH